jgi:large subunit ribosomal protein L24
MQKIRKGDIVQAVRGKDKGKKGKVLEVFTSTGRLLVEGVNLVKKHRRQRRQEEKGGIVSIESPISVANVMLVCKACAKPVRVGFSVLKDSTKVRVCKACKEAV